MQSQSGKRKESSKREREREIDDMWSQAGTPTQAQNDKTMSIFLFHSYSWKPKQENTDAYVLSQWFNSTIFPPKPAIYQGSPQSCISPPSPVSLEELMDWKW